MVIEMKAVLHIFIIDYKFYDIVAAIYLTK